MFFFHKWILYYYLENYVVKLADTNKKIFPSDYTL